jgi:protein tyrosine phosphatase (PTP) superfamily phosphohydrolase (DUF442 family)
MDEPGDLIPARTFIDTSLTVGGPPNLLGIRRLAWEGFVTLMDLRPHAVDSVEQEEAEIAGLAYIARPLPRAEVKALERSLLDIVQEARPLYLFCEDGRTALMLGLMTTGEMQSAGQVFARMAARGVPMLDAERQQAARAWFAARGLEPKPPSTILAAD